MLTGRDVHCDNIAVLLTETMADNLEQSILTALSTKEQISTIDFAAEIKTSHQDVIGALKSLESNSLVLSQVQEVSMWKLSKEGLEVLASGSPEMELWQKLAAGPMDQKTLQATFSDAERFKVAMGNAIKAKLVKTSKVDNVAMLARLAESAKDSTQEILREAQAQRHVDPADCDTLKRRQLATFEKVKFFLVKKGPAFTTTWSKPESDITKEMLLDGSWEKKSFKPYNLQRAEGKPPAGGQLHPLLKVRQEFREIFLELGFQEMNTCNWVENSMWNFDALFVGQHHPARDSQDTFFISRPAQAEPVDADYLQRVKTTHETGYLCRWSGEESRRNVLRTHTTAVSSHLLYQMAQLAKSNGGQFTPGKFFSIDRVFRNEEMDKTHLCEFHQIEGFVVDRNLSLANMMHVLHQFFKKIGVEKLRFKPTYNPYTEPSMEIFGWHEGFQKWVEVGNSGMFRPEMLTPMGFDKDVTAIAWGLSLERPTMIKYNIKNIHELFGHKVDLNFVRRSMICRY